MRVKDGFVLREVAGQAMVIATGEASRDFHGMVKLNGTGRLIWEGLSRGVSEQEMAEALVTEYDVSVEEARSDVDAFVDKMREAGFLVE